MAHSLFGIFLVIILISILVLGALGIGIHLYGVSEIVGGAYGSRLQTYADYNLGLSIRYPSDFVVDQNYAYAGMGRDLQVRGVSFAVPESKLKNTNLLPGTQVSVEVIPNMPSCNVQLFMLNPNNIRSFIEGDVLYSSAIEKKANAKDEYEEQVYAVSGASPCVAVRYSIHSAPMTSYNASAMHAYARNDLISVFDTMRRSLVVQK